METGKVVANIMQMDECIAQIRQASTTVTEATNTVDSHNRALPPDRYDSEAARQYRANYTGASRKLVDVQDTLTILANNLENARERIMQASGVTDQMIIDQKIRVSELRKQIDDSKDSITELEADIRAKEADIQDRYDDRNLSIGWSSVAGAGAYLSYIAGVGGLALCSTGLGCAIGWIGVVGGGIGFLATVGSGGAEYQDADNDVIRIQNEIDDTKKQIETERNNVNDYEQELRNITPSKYNNSGASSFYLDNNVPAMNPSTFVYG